MKKFLLSLAAMAFMAFGAQAEKLDVLGSLSNDAYDPATQTITFDASWGWVNWWFGDADYSAYDEFVIEFEPVSYTVQLMAQYADGTEDNSAQAMAGESVCTLPLDAAGKAHVKQIAIQNSEPGTLVLKAAYFQNAVVVDPSADIVLFEGEADMANNWYPGLELDKTKVINAGAGTKLTIDYTCTGDGVSYKLCTNWTNDIIPGFANVEGFQPEWSSVWTSLNPITYTFTAEDIQTLQDNADNSFRISGGGDGFVITKVTLTPDAGNKIDEVINNNAVENGKYYNLQGVEVANPTTPGIYIHNGKKFVVK